MPRSKKQSSRAARTLAALKPKSAKAKVTKTTVNRKSAPRRSTHLTERIRGTPVVLLENGLVSMEKTPHHLVQIVDNNTKNSNLLRLPGEIRNMIWALAMGGNYVRVKRVIHNITGNKFWVKTKLYAQATLTDNTLRSSGFKLPQVCRQIYAETATLGYKLNTFILEHNNWPKEAIGHLLLAQKDAVESILLEMTLFESYISSNVGYSIRSRYPNLKRIEVPDCAFGFKQFPSGNDHWMNASTHGWWWEWAIEKIQQKEGQNIEIIFYS